ncbi:MAG: hypothetical protein M3O34_03365 [Chloroflexota bacterium]|nr:hypothetical protein [Chloroflexota bacterium]
MHKKEYRPPRLLEYGRMESLTLGKEHCPSDNEDHPGRAGVFLTTIGTPGHRSAPSASVPDARERP